MDLAVPGAAAELVARVAALGLTIDVLVNNAGVGTYGRFTEIDATDDARMLQLNMVFLTELTRLVAVDMKRRRRGRILNVASTAAFQPGPMMATYYATKAYVLSLSEALASELADDGITVTAVCPGPTLSGFQAQAKMEGARMLKLLPMTSAQVARQAVRALERGSAVKITGLVNNLLAQSVRVTPRWLVTRLSRFFAARATA
jgi:short-subunit dehydrogenase